MSSKSNNQPPSCNCGKPTPCASCSFWIMNAYYSKLTLLKKETPCSSCNGMIILKSPIKMMDSCNFCRCVRDACEKMSLERGYIWKLHHFNNFDRIMIK